MSQQGWTQVVIRDGRGRVDRLCFGRPVQTVRRHRPERGEESLVRFCPGQRFGLVRWRRDRFGHQRWVLLVAEAVGRTETPALRQACQTTGVAGAGTASAAAPPTAFKHPKPVCRTAVPDIEPAVRLHLVLEQLGPAGSEGVVDRMLGLLAALRRDRLNPADLHPAYLADAAHRLMVGQTPRRPDLGHELLRNPACDN